MARKMKKVTAVETADLEAMAKQYVDLRYERDDASKRMEGVRDVLLEAMEGMGEDSTIAGTYSIVVSHPKSAALDEAGLSEELGKRMWDKITTRVLDRNKLDAFIKSGEIDPDTVAAYTEITERNPSLRVTAKK